MYAQLVLFGAQCGHVYCIKDGSSTSVLVLKSALSTFSEMLDCAFEYIKLVSIRHGYFNLIH